MNPDEYGRMFDLEDHYWWFVGRRNVALRLLRKALRGKQEARVLDVGCGTGVVLRELEQMSMPVGLDMSPLALGFCKRRGLKRLVRGDGQQLPFASATFDGIIGLDIFEHIPDDRRAFEEAFRILTPGGCLVLSVPAFRALWGPHDIALMHQRRYTRAEMRQRLEAAGFRIERLSYSVFFLFPIVVLVRMIEKRRKGPAKASLAPLPAWMNRSLTGLQHLEAGLLQRVALPWGSSVVAVARKPD